MSGIVDIIWSVPYADFWTYFILTPWVRSRLTANLPSEGALLSLQSCLKLRTIMFSFYVCSSPTATLNSTWNTVISTLSSLPPTSITRLRLFLVAPKPPAFGGEVDSDGLPAAHWTTFVTSLKRFVHLAMIDIVITPAFVQDFVDVRPTTDPRSCHPDVTSMFQRTAEELFPGGSPFNVNVIFSDVV